MVESEKGEQYAKIKGKKKGQDSLITFHRIADLLDELKFADLDNEYEPRVTDNPTTFTTAVISGKRKTVSNYAEGGPTGLWAIEQLIDGVRSVG